MKVSAGVETGSSDWYFFKNSCKFLKQEGTGNVHESIKRAKKGVHVFSLCGRRYYHIRKGIISKQWHVSSFFEFKLLFVLKFLVPFQQKSYLLRNAERS